MRKVLIGSLAIVVCVALAMLLLAPSMVERQQNQVIAHQGYSISDAAKRLHESLFIGDLHADTTLWNRDFGKNTGRGHVDLPRMRQGNAALQMFTTVTKTPSGQNYQENSNAARDNITLLAMVQAWPVSTWTSLTERALHQAEKLHKLAAKSSEKFYLIRSRAELDAFVDARKNDTEMTAGLLGTEGSHALDGDLNNIQKLFDAGFRMMSLQHFFDNQLGGSLHGESGAGLSEFGFKAVDEMLKLGIMVDVSHSSEQVVSDVLARTTEPLIVSHTGFHGHCASARNISDELMVRIAKGGGLIGVGYWDGAVCEPTAKSIVQAIRYGIDLVGVDHVALGSDFDGGIESPFDVSELAVLTEHMLQADFTETEIRKVMGGNMLRFLQANLPER